MPPSLHWLFGTTLALAPLLPATALAQPSIVAKRSIYDPGRYITEERIKEVHDAFQDLVRPEKSRISMVDAREIVTIGTFSAMAQSCGLPWEEQIYKPFIIRYRDDRKLSAKHMQFVVFMHGF